jgi:hypothetical protein
MRGLCPRAPGIYRFGPEWHQSLEGDREVALPFQRLAGARVASLRCPILRPGTDQYTSVDFILEKALPLSGGQGINELVLVSFRWPVLK